MYGDLETPVRWFICFKWFWAWRALRRKHCSPLWGGTCDSAYFLCALHLLRFHCDQRPLIIFDSKTLWCLKKEKNRWSCSQVKFLSPTVEWASCVMPSPALAFPEAGPGYLDDRRWALELLLSLSLLALLTLPGPSARPQCPAPANNSFWLK